MTGSNQEIVESMYVVDLSDVPIVLSEAIKR